MRRRERSSETPSTHIFRSSRPASHTAPHSPSLAANRPRDCCSLLVAHASRPSFLPPAEELATGVFKSVLDSSRYKVGRAAASSRRLVCSCCPASGIRCHKPVLSVWARVGGHASGAWSFDLILTVSHAMLSTHRLGQADILLRAGEKSPRRPPYPPLRSPTYAFRSLSLCSTSCTSRTEVRFLPFPPISPPASDASEPPAGSLRRAGIRRGNQPGAWHHLSRGPSLLLALQAGCVFQRSDGGKWAGSSWRGTKRPSGLAASCVVLCSVRWVPRR